MENLTVYNRIQALVALLTLSVLFIVSNTALPYSAGSLSCITTSFSSIFPLWPRTATPPVTWFL